MDTDPPQTQQPVQYSTPLLDALCQAALDPVNAEREKAQEMLLGFQSEPNSYLRVPTILSETTSESTRFFALQIMEQMIKYHWGTLSVEQRSEVREFIFQTLMQVASQIPQQHKGYVRKLRQVLVEILKLDWPADWPQFMDNLLQSAYLSTSLLENNLLVLTEFSEEMHVFYELRISGERGERMREGLANEFHKIFPLLSSILTQVPQLSPTNPNYEESLHLVQVALQAVSHYFEWIEDKWIFETGLLDSLFPCLAFEKLQINTMRSLSIIGATTPPEGIDIVKYIIGVLTALEAMVVTLNEEEGRTWEAWRENVEDEGLMTSLALLLTAMFATHINEWNTLEVWEEHQRLLNLGHYWLFKLTTGEEQDIVKICFDYWAHFISDVHEDRAILPMHDPSVMLPSPTDIQGQPRELTEIEILAKISYMGVGEELIKRDTALWRIWRKRCLMSGVLDWLREAVVISMVAPSEFQTLDDAEDVGTALREALVDTEALALHALMRDSIVYLSHVHFLSTFNGIKAALRAQMESAIFSREALTRICWVLGCLATRLTELFIPGREGLQIAFEIDNYLQTIPQNESNWFVEIINSLLDLLDRRTDPEEKTAVGVNLIYLFGKYPTFLNQNTEFLKVAVRKIFDFVEDAPRIPLQSMFIVGEAWNNVAYFCRPELSKKLPPDQNEPLVQQLLQRELSLVLTKITNLNLQCTFFSGFGSMIRHHYGRPSLDPLMAELFMEPNKALASIFVNAATDASTLSTPATCAALYRILRINVAGSLTAKSCYSRQFRHLYPYLVQLFPSISALIREAFQQYGPAAAGHSNIRALRLVKKGIYQIMNFNATGVVVDAPFPEEVQEDEDPVQVEASRALVVEFTHEQLPTLMTMMADDYAASDPAIVEVQYYEMVDKLVGSLNRYLLPVEMGLCIDPVLNRGFEMIQNGTLGEFTEQRRLIYFICSFVTSTRVLKPEHVPKERTDKLMAIAQHGVRIFNRDVAKNSLIIFYNAFTWCPPLQIPAHRPPLPLSTVVDFVRVYGKPILDVVWEVMSDTEHKNAYENQAAVIARLWEIITRNTLRMFEDSEYEDGETNYDWMLRWFVTSIQKTFPEVGKDTATFLFEKLHALPRRDTKEEDVFGLILLDFFLGLQHYKTTDNSALYLQAREKASKELEEKRNAKIRTVSGLKEAEKPLIPDFVHNVRNGNAVRS